MTSVSEEQSIFRRYYTEEPFVDRFAQNSDGAVDIIIPVMHTNELWEANLRSFYREVPVKRLYIGDGGCIDNSIEIVRRFPRVTVLDHRSFTSLGYSIRKLIEAVESEWFIYMHSDVFLPPGWFDAMRGHQSHYDWFGCPMRHTILVEYDLDYRDRPWAGTQMGRKAVFEKHLDTVDDDYVYRQEDFVFAEIARRGGGREGKVSDTFHYHQTMRRPTRWGRKVTSVRVDVELAPDERVRQSTMEFKGTVKYLSPTIPWAVNEMQGSVIELLEMGAMSWREIREFIAETNKSWLPFVSRSLLIRRQMHHLTRLAYRAVFKYW